MIGICKVCQQEKELVRYQKEPGGKDYFRKHCRQCWSAHLAPAKAKYRLDNIDKVKIADAAKYERNKDKLTSGMKRYYRKLQSIVLMHYGNQCACCGENQTMFLTIDHMDNDGAEHRKKIGIGHIFYRWLIDHDFPNNFQILCNNCNSGKHRNGGICPHESKRLNYTSIEKVYQPSNWIL